MTTTIEFTKKLAERYVEMWSTGDVSGAAEIVAPTWTDHAHPDSSSLDGLMAAVQKQHAAIPTLRMQTELIIAEADLVVFRVGAWNALDTSGKINRFLLLARVEDERLAELWTYQES